jgi:hypothetical protein
MTVWTAGDVDNGIDGRIRDGGKCGSRALHIPKCNNARIHRVCLMVHNYNNIHAHCPLNLDRAWALHPAVCIYKATPSLLHNCYLFVASGSSLEEERMQEKLLSCREFAVYNSIHGMT